MFPRNIATKNSEIYSESLCLRKMITEALKKTEMSFPVNVMSVRNYHLKNYHLNRRLRKTVGQIM
jgi:hypothetical protein